VGSRPDEVNFSTYLIVPVTLDPEVYSASNRNEYQKHKNVSGEQSPYRPPWPVTGIALLLIFTFTATQCKLYC
jgi:hypothetical protein